jgi:hypothetical protein
VAIHETPPRNTALQVSETDFEKRLTTRFPLTNKLAIRRDIDSLTAIHQLRKGRTFGSLRKSVAVFVTHNYALFQESARLFDHRPGGRQIPHCLHDAAFTTMVWLRAPRKAPDLPRERVIADASAALVPSDALWRKYNAEVRKLQERGEVDDEAVAFLRYAEEARRLLMDTTQGDAEAFTEGTVPELLELYQERVRNEAREELRQEQRAHEDTRSEIEHVDKRLEALSRAIAHTVAKALFWLVVVLVAAGTILGPVGPVNGPLGTFPQGICAALALGLAIWSGVSGGSLKAVRQAVAGWLSSKLHTFLERVVRH